MAFPDAWMNELMNRNEIVSVISDYTQLAPKGGRMWGLCPFHPERNASLSVSPDKQLFHCFSCKAGGSVIQFIMQAEKLTYAEAVAFLAQRVGMDMPEEQNDARLRAEKALRDRLYKANIDAAKFFHEKLLEPAGAECRKYLLKRGIDGGTATRFGLGYAPNDWDALFRHMTALGYSRDELITAGLCVRGRQDPNKTFDFFHDRLMIPIINASGRVLAFGGRVLGGDSQAKYMNTGDTPIYNKSCNVFGINLMKGKKIDEFIMVEGYMDVIGLHQFGIDNAIASLGTALTPQQVRLMSRYVKRVYYAYDGDAAGQNAMLRNVDIVAAGGLEPRVIVIPGGKDDPDDFVRKYGRDAFLKLRDSSITAVRFKLDAMAKAVDLDTEDGRQTYAKNACRLLASLEPVERDRYIKLVSERSGISADTIREQVGLSKPEQSEKRPYPSSAARFRRERIEFDKRAAAEITLLACMMASKHDCARIEQLDGFDASVFSQPGLADFAQRLREEYRGGANADLHRLMGGAEELNAEAISSAAAQTEEITDPVETAEACLNSIKCDECERRIRELTALAEAQTDKAKRGELLREQMQLVLKLRSLKDGES